MRKNEACEEQIGLKYTDYAGFAPVMLFPARADSH